MVPPVVADSVRAYYDRRAAEYDEWWTGTGAFATRPRPGWAAEVERLVEVVGALAGPRTLDVACGTGFLTRHLGGAVVGIDQSETMLELARGRCPELELVHGDAVPLRFEDESFDTVFTSHFYGHLEVDERERFLAEARRVGRRLVVVDAALRPDVLPEQWQPRRLNDGSRHAVYKRYFTAAGLSAELGGGEVLHDGRWFVVVATGPGVRTGSSALA